MAHAAASAAAASLRRWARGVILGSSVDVHPSRRASGVFLAQGQRCTDLSRESGDDSDRPVGVRRSPIFGPVAS